MTLSGRFLAVLAVLAGSAATARAQSHILYTDSGEGVYILRDPGLARALKQNDLLCGLYEKKQDEAERLASAGGPKKKSRLREEASVQAAAHRLMGECLNADLVVRKRLERLFGAKAIDRLVKVSAFEDMAYVQLQPNNAQGYAELFGESPRSYAQAPVRASAR